MARFLVDEDLPRSLAPWLNAAGLSAEDVRDRGLRGQPDDDVFHHAVAHRFAVVSGDLGFGNIVRFRSAPITASLWPASRTTGPSARSNAAILAGLRGLTDEEITGNLVVIEPGRVRLRRQP